MNSLLVAFIVIFLNLLFLDWQILQLINKPNPIQQNETKTSEVSLTPKTEMCSQNCLDVIKQATSTAQPMTTMQTSAPSTSQAYFVPFGSGSIASSDWQDISGLQAYVDTANYNGIKTVTFEASVHVPTGNETVNVRLFNVTDGHPVWYSEVFFNGGTNAQLLVSKPISLDQGNKLYQVQMKTQLTFPAILDQARLHILTY